MTTTPPDSLTDLSGPVKQSWQRFLDLYEPLRPELYRYCRYLTRSPWDAEDLVQDAMARAFVTLGCLFQEVPNPRAWLFRVASNLWIDRMRRTREIPDPATDAAVLREPRAAREAAGTLIARLAPQERAAVLLKDVFDFKLEEIAEALSTTVGAVKTALHRGRGKLLEPDPPEPQPPLPAALDAFCEAFNARDVDRMTALLLETSTVEIVGVVTEYGAEATKNGSFAGAFGSIAFAEGRGGVKPHLLEGYRPAPPRAEARMHRGAAILLFWYAHDDGEAVRAVACVETEGDRLSSMRDYFFTPDVIAEVCRELKVPFRVNGYRYW